MDYIILLYQKIFLIFLEILLVCSLVSFQMD